MLVFVCGCLIVLISIFTCAEVICRNFFGFSFQGVDEISGYLMALISAVGFGYSVISRNHIRIDSAIQFTRGRLRAGLDILAYLALTWIACLFSFYAAKTFDYSFSVGSRSQTPLSVPLWIPQVLWLIGLVLFTCAAAYTTIRAIVIWMRSGTDATIEHLHSDEIDESLKEARSAITARSEG